MTLAEIVVELRQHGRLADTMTCHYCGQEINDEAGGLCDGCWNLTMDELEGNRRDDC